MTIETNAIWWPPRWITFWYLWIWRNHVNAQSMSMYIWSRGIKINLIIIVLFCTTPAKRRLLRRVRVKNRVGVFVCVCVGQRKTKDRADGVRGKKYPLPSTGFEPVSLGYAPIVLPIAPRRQARLPSVETNTSECVYVCVCARVRTHV